MRSDHRDVYILRGDGDGGADDASAWLVPEPADEVIVDELLGASDLSREDIDPLEEYVDFAALHALLSGDDTDDVSFDVEGWTVTVTADGTVSVADAE